MTLRLRLLDAWSMLGPRVVSTLPLHLLRPRQVMMIRDLTAPIEALALGEPWRWTEVDPQDEAAIVELHQLDARVSIAEIRQRFARKEICLCCYHGSSLAHCHWLSPGPEVRLPFVHVTLKLLDGDIYSYGIYTAPAFRRRGIWKDSHTEGYRWGAAHGFRRQVGFATDWNFTSRPTPELARRAMGRVGYWNLGLKRVHFAEGACAIDDEGRLYARPTPA